MAAFEERGGRPYRRPRPGGRLLGLILALMLGLAGCGRSPARPAPARPATPAVAPVRAVDGTPARVAGAQAAWATRDVGVWSEPGGGELTGTFAARQPWGDPTVFLVLERRTARTGGTWYRVLLPRRPNGSTGWIRGDRVRLVPLAYQVEVDLAARSLRLYRDGRLVGRFPVAIGAPATPTPTGRFFVAIKLRPPRISPAFGAWALGLSGYSDVLDQFGTGDGQIALHGTDDVSVLGRAVSHGCVRLDNRAITTLATLLPLGSPVTIHA